MPLGRLEHGHQSLGKLYLILCGRKRTWALSRLNFVDVSTIFYERSQLNWIFNLISFYRYSRYYNRQLNLWVPLNPVVNPMKIMEKVTFHLWRRRRPMGSEMLGTASILPSIFMARAILLHLVWRCFPLGQDYTVFWKQTNERPKFVNVGTFLFLTPNVVSEFGSISRI